MVKKSIQQVDVTHGISMLRFDQKLDGIQTKYLILFSRKHPTGIVAVNEVKSSVSSDDFSQLLKPGTTVG